jgi:hypothetical protein
VAIGTRFCGTKTFHVLGITPDKGTNWHQGVTGNKFCGDGIRENGVHNQETNFLRDLTVSRAPQVLRKRPDPTPAGPRPFRVYVVEVNMTSKNIKGVLHRLDLVKCPMEPLRAAKIPCGVADHPNPDQRPNRVLGR